MSDGGAYQIQGSGLIQLRELTRESGPVSNLPPATQDADALLLYNYARIAFGNGFILWSTRFVCGLE